MNALYTPNLGPYLGFYLEGLVVHHRQVSLPAQCLAPTWPLSSPSSASIVYIIAYRYRPYMPSYLGPI